MPYDMNGWTDDKITRAMVLLGEEIASEITPEQMVAVAMPEYSIAATVESACRDELKRRGDGRYRELYEPGRACIRMDAQVFGGVTPADTMISALEGTPA